MTTTKWTVETTDEMDDPETLVFESFAKAHAYWRQEKDLGKEADIVLVQRTKLIGEDVA